MGPCKQNPNTSFFCLKSYKDSWCLLEQKLKLFHLLTTLRNPLPFLSAPWPGTLPHGSSHTELAFWSSKHTSSFRLCASCAFFRVSFPNNTDLLPTYDVMSPCTTFTVLFLASSPCPALPTLSVKKMKESLCSGPRVITNACKRCRVGP